MLDTLTKGKSPALRALLRAGAVPLGASRSRGAAAALARLWSGRPSGCLGEPVALSPQSAWRPAAELARGAWCGGGNGVGAGRRGGARWGGAGGLSGNVACEPACVRSSLAARALVARGSIARGVGGTGVVERCKGEEGGSFPLPWCARPLLLGQSALLYACFWKQLNFLGAVILPEL